jgi:hypothetical protein
MHGSFLEGNIIGQLDALICIGYHIFLIASTQTDHRAFLVAF